MVLGITTTKLEKKQQLLDVREAFNLWDILKSKYNVIEFLTTLSNFTHDQDLIYIMNAYVTDLRKNVKILESLLRDYAIAGPSQDRLSSQWKGNPEPTRDEQVAFYAMLYIQEHTSNLLRSFRTSITNERVRSVFMNMLKRTIAKSDKLYKYAKIKGWIETPPLYPNIPPTTSEKICCGTASHLWDLVTFRYDNIRQTKVFLNYANDSDLKFLLQEGLEGLKKQVNVLEEECQKFGIPLPKRPPKIVGQPENTELFTDDQIYRTVLSGFQGAGIMHSEALKQCVLNDRIRSIFVKLIFQEISFYNSFAKYGKVKGWLHPAPAYRV